MVSMFLKKKENGICMTFVGVVRKEEFSTYGEPESFKIVSFKWGSFRLVQSG